MNPQEHLENSAIRIRRGKVDSLSVYEITDYELDILIKGSPGTIFLNFSIFLLSIAISFLISLITTKIESDRIFSVFVIVTIIGGIAGLVLGVLWWRTRYEVSDLVTKIKARIPRDEIIKETAKQVGTDQPTTCPVSPPDGNENT